MFLYRHWIVRRLSGRLPGCMTHHTPRWKEVGLCTTDTKHTHFQVVHTYLVGTQIQALPATRRTGLQVEPYMFLLQNPLFAHTFPIIFPCQFMHYDHLRVIVTLCQARVNVNLHEHAGAEMQKRQLLTCKAAAISARRYPDQSGTQGYISQVEKRPYKVKWKQACTQAREMQRKRGRMQGRATETTK